MRDRPERTGDDDTPRVTLPPASLAPFRRLSLYNSPYPAHDAGHAIDLYPDTNEGFSPVAGEVLATRTVRTPTKPYAAAHDHLILVAPDDDWCVAAGVEGVVARVLHVDPAVEAGDRVAVGDSLGEMVRSGFFAPWVDNHVHLGFRTPDQNLVRASGSLPVSLPAPPTPLAWDGEGTVVETGETYVVLDSPAHPGRDAGWCGIVVGDPDAESARGAHAGVLDGGLPHYDGGGVLDATAIGGGTETGTERVGPVSLLGRVVGDRHGRTVTWRDVVVEANGRPAVGLSLFLARAGPAGAKVVCPGHEFEPGQRVTVRIVERST
ncbi:hypothetical protein [Salinigranum marinum]|uniref:hypothetical protein n=1 Tax=Salinigranum marinum TaxID=1515595 RepID=UPI002989F1D8|nr:hypothetical protein [Salinigranum marinum]